MDTGEAKKWAEITIAGTECPTAARSAIGSAKVLPCSYFMNRAGPQLMKWTKSVAVGLGVTILGCTFQRAGVPQCRMQGVDDWRDGCVCELDVFIEPEKQVEIIFPKPLGPGLHRGPAQVALERNGNRLLGFAQPELTVEGWVKNFRLVDETLYKVRFRRATREHPMVNTINLPEEASCQQGEP